MIVFVGPRSHLDNMGEERNWVVVEEVELPEEVRSVIPDAARAWH